MRSEVEEHKEALIGAAIASAFDPKPTEAELMRIDRGQDLRAKLIDAAEILARRIAQIWQLIAMLRLPAPPVQQNNASPIDETALRAQLALLFEPHRAEIRVPPEQAARLLRALAFAGIHPRMTDQPLTPHEIVSLLLDGIRAPEEDP
jgi:hypothetical protein